MIVDTSSFCKKFRLKFPISSQNIKDTNLWWWVFSDQWGHHGLQRRLPVCCGGAGSGLLVALLLILKYILLTRVLTHINTGMTTYVSSKMVRCTLFTCQWFGVAATCVRHCCRVYLAAQQQCLDPLVPVSLLPSQHHNTPTVNISSFFL